MTKRNPLERDVKSDVKKILDAHKIFWWMPPNNGYGQTGISDFNGLRDHVFFAIETKLALRKRTPTPMQKGFLGSVKAEGGFAFVVTEATLPYLEMFLDAFDRSTQAASRGEKPSLEDGALMLDCIKIMEELWVGGDYKSLDKLMEEYNERSAINGRPRESA